MLLQMSKVIISFTFCDAEVCWNYVFMGGERVECFKGETEPKLNTMKKLTKKGPLSR